MFKSVFSKNLKDPLNRSRVVASTMEQARAAYGAGKSEEAREAILRLRDQFDDAGIDRLELLYAADSALADDCFWLREIVEILLRKTGLSDAETSYLQRLALLEPTRINLWKRLLKERQIRDDAALLLQAREQCALALIGFFSGEGADSWPDPPSRSEALELTMRVLDETVDVVVSTGRDDATGRRLLRAAMDILPDPTAARRQYARLIVRSDDRSPQNLGAVLEALVEQPENRELRLWAGRALLDTPGHHGEGLMMLRQLCEERPSDKRSLEFFVSALKSDERLDEQDVSWIQAYLANNPTDIRASELLADFYAEHEVLTDDALRLYRLVAASSPKRSVYLRRLGQASASRSDWTRVIEIFSEVRESGEGTADIIIPLATAYSEFEQADAEALAVYKQAIALGTRRLEIHNLYCRHLYKTNPAAAESVTQFVSSAKACPDCAWAQLGVTAHFLESGDARRALDNALELLAKQPGDIEATELAAQALAADFSRTQLAKLAHLQPPLLRRLFERSYALAPDAGPVALGLVRRRLADGVSDTETVRILGEVCRKHPEATDLRVARANMLWDLDQKENAVELYAELIERWRARTAQESPRPGDAEWRQKVLIRVAEFKLQPPGPKPADMDLLMEASAEPQTGREMLLRIARALIDLQTDHPHRLPLLQRALEIAPEDPKIERAIAEGHASNGNPIPAFRLAVRLVRAGNVGEETANLLRSVRAVMGTRPVPTELVEELRACLDPDDHPAATLLAANELIAETGGPAPADLPVLEKLHHHFPRNMRVRRRLAECLTACDRHDAAAEHFQALMRESRGDDDDLLLQMVLTNARLGRRDRRDFAIAQRAVELSPKNPDLVLHLAAHLLEEGKTLEAVQRLDWLLENHPNSHLRIQTLMEQYRTLSTEQGALQLIHARVHIKCGRAEQAMMALSRLMANYESFLGELVPCYLDIIDLIPDNPRPYVELAILYRLSGRIEESLENLATAHVLAPDNLDILGEYADTLNQKVRSRTDPAPDAATRCGEMYLELGDETNAYEMVEIALGASPDDNEALRLLARLQLNTGDLHNCWATVKRIEKDMSLLGLLQELARAFADEEEQDLAADVLTDAIQVAGPQRELIEQLRTLYQEQARSTAGNSMRQKVLGSLSEKARGRYELREQIASGAMGIVYKAYDRELDEIVVLKVLPEHFGRDEEALALFRNEAKAARKLAHPNICRIHDIGEEDGRKHISMEYVAGGDLRQMLKDSPDGIFVGEALRIVREIARALGHAHAEGVLHRDIKAGNILLTPNGRVKLSDFGIAALTEAASQRIAGAESAGTVVGTPLYMSPEQFDHARLGPASDMYSLGILFYEILSGAPPFTRGSIAYHHRFTPPEPLKNIPAELWAVVEKLLRKKPEERYPSANDLLMALDVLEQSITAVE